MASSVASAREMERWARERREAVQRSVHMPLEAKKQMSAMTADLDALATFERKVQQLAQRQEEKEEALAVDPVINVMGSTAGAGSGEFHTYRGYRTKELARLADMEKEAVREKAQREWEEERRQAQEEVESKTAKNAEKRNKKKEKKRAAMAAEKAAKAAKRAAGSSAGPAAQEAEGEECEPDEHAQDSD
jgi:hypothetical protein